jgi:hypothetical protein
MNELKPWLLGGVVGALLGVLTAVGIVQPKEVTELVPTTGEQGYPVAEFCADPLTKVRDTTIPGVSEQTYELVRLKDGVQETVTWIGTTDGATHWFNVNGAQTQEPAVVDDEAKKCIAEKARTP